MLRNKLPSTFNYKKDSLLFQVIDWKSYDIFEDEEDDEEEEEENDKKKKKKIRKLIIRAYGVTDNGNSICVHINDFQPYFFFKIPQEWTNTEFNYFKNHFIDLVDEKSRDGLVNSGIVKKKEFYGFTNNELFSYGIFIFSNQSSYYAYLKIIKEHTFKLKKFNNIEFNFNNKLYETKVSSLLRFFHVKNLDPSGWAKIEAGKYTINNPSLTRCQLDISIKYNDIERVELNSMSEMMIASFDIECCSDDGTFPKFERKNDPVIQIGTTVYAFGESECRYKYIATLNKCDPIEGAHVECFKTEQELILGWARFIQKLDPDIITGYNIWGFDWEYIFGRAKSGNGGQIAKYEDKLYKILQRLKPDQIQYRKTELTVQDLSSSALGVNILKFIDIEGVVQIDLLKVVQRDHKLDSYKLDNVAKHFMKQQKVDLSPKEMFMNFKEGTPEKIKEIAVYCIMDCKLVNDLINKLQVITNNLGMSNVCVVPFSYLFLRGQGIKIFSLVAKFCREENFLIKDLLSDDIDKSSYEGAIVFVPVPGVYFEPVVVMDYNSLYPSSMIAENISHDSILGFKEYKMKPKKNTVEADEYELTRDTINEKYNNLDGYHYNDIEYDIFEGLDDDKKKVGYKVCTFAEADNGEKSVLPRILRKLLKARKDTRKIMEYETFELTDGSYVEGIPDEKETTYELFNVVKGKIMIDKDKVVSKKKTNNEFQISVLDGLQLAYKVTCNSLYGQVGATTSPICYKELAACTTATGRKMVTTARDLTLGTFVGAKLTYGDSVTGDTPLLLKKNNEIFVRTIQDLNNEWMPYEEFKPFDTNRREKEQTSYDSEIWTNGKWAKINRVIRHKTQKKIYRIFTHTGCVDVTEDHSLLNENLEIVKPSEVSVGTRLRHGFTDEFIEKDYGISCEEAFLWGVFMGDGTSGIYDSGHGKKYSWTIYNQDKNLLNKLMDYGKVVLNIDFELLDTMESPNLYKLVPTEQIKDLAVKYRKMFYTNDKYKIVPNEILNSPMNIKEKFMEGLYAGNGCLSIDVKDKITAQSIYLLLRSMDYNVYMNTITDKADVFSLNYTKEPLKKEFDRIEKIDLLYENNFDDYVYDIETTDGTFQAGIGQLIVKNTDSIFVNFTDEIKRRNPGKDFTEKELLAESIKIGQEAAANINKNMKAPQNIEYEKTFWPFCIFSKKRYFGNKYEHSTEKYKQTSMGIVLKRRDNAPIVKTIYGGVIDIILNKRNVEASKKFFYDSIKDLLEGKTDISQLVISKTLRIDYANPTQIAHKVLADRMGERDPGNKPQSNDRIPYCYIDSSNLKCKICSMKINPDKCKCVTCMSVFCSAHLFNHKDICTKMCRFCKTTHEHGSLTNCMTCRAYYCIKCNEKHKTRKDKYGQEHTDKCKKELTHKLLQGDTIEHPQYILDNKFKVDTMYYLEHQIEKPVNQIFELVMKNPGTIIADLIRNAKNLKNGNHSIKEWFKAVNKNNNVNTPVKVETDGKKEEDEKKKFINCLDDEEEDLLGFEVEEDPESSLVAE